MSEHEQDATVVKLRGPLAADVITAAAEQHGVCVRPFTMEVTDSGTGAMRYVGVPCGSTVESVCAPCAKKAKALRMVQCREGWHLDTEPVDQRGKPTADQRAVVEYRADLVAAYRESVEAGEAGHADELRDEIRVVDDELHGMGVRGRLPNPDDPGKRAPKRSTRRRQDAPNLPRLKVARRTLGREYAGGYRPSMFVTLTCDSYGPVRGDGSPVNPGTYDYRRAARDAVHFASLVDRWWQNLRRAVGWDVQYFATVEPQKRTAPHLHAALRGSIPHEVIRQVTAATYLQVWWPPHDEPVYGGYRLPVWDHDARGFVDPDTRAALLTWTDAVDQVDAPAHVATFGRQVHSKGILGGSEEAGRHVGYLTKYLTKSTGEVVEATTDAQQAHHDRLHAELERTPCSPRCAVWLLYGVQPVGASSKTTPGHCRGRAHRRTTLGLPGRRVLVSRKWSGKTLVEHKADRRTFVHRMLAAVGIAKPQEDASRFVWRKLAPGDQNAPPRAHLLMHAISERITWRAEYERALLAAQPPPGSGGPDLSATQQAA
ncbi:replication initiator protein [Actinokineospora sp. PR83]|uniref:replication initiator n=1 Tax=Actinokineospora sp. PR83 TaxID=2884908 RepID=UPI001F37096C|nr:replication initiator [Actinokineospora sp. PR83]MCG8914830.1 replication initiator protein [Actinokineospora sp. PR83]